MAYILATQTQHTQEKTMLNKLLKIMLILILLPVACVCTGIVMVPFLASYGAYIDANTPSYEYED